MADEDKAAETEGEAVADAAVEGASYGVDMKALEDRLAAAEKAAEDAQRANAELLERMSGLKTAEEFEAAVGEVRQAAEAASAALQKMKARDQVRREFSDIPEGMFDFVSGDTEEELRASAARMREALPKGGVNGVPRQGGGLNPGNDDEAFDVDKAVASIPRY